MLYLNGHRASHSACYYNLTLTSVVFELLFSTFNTRGILFNFNKCCIWILVLKYEAGGNPDLTLTSVVFEF